MYPAIAAAAAMLVPARAAGISPFRQRCGELSCDALDYCSEDGRCEPCAPICDAHSHNSDDSLCVKECQNYLFDARYVKRSEDTTLLQATVQHLQFEVSVVTIICSLLLTFLVAFLLVCCFRNHKKYWNRLQKIIQDKKSSRNLAGLELTHQNPHTVSPVLPRRTKTTNQQVNKEPQQEPPRSGNDDPGPQRGERTPQIQQEQLRKPEDVTSQNNLRQEVPKDQVAPKDQDERNPTRLLPVGQNSSSTTRQEQSTLDVSGLESLAAERNRSGELVNHIPRQHANMPRTSPNHVSSQVDEIDTTDLNIEVISQPFDISALTDMRSPSEDCLLSYGESDATRYFTSPNESYTNLNTTRAPVRLPVMPPVSEQRKNDNRISIISTAATVPAHSVTASNGPLRGSPQIRKHEDHNSPTKINGMSSPIHVSNNSSSSSGYVNSNYESSLSNN